MDHLRTQLMILKNRNIYESSIALNSLNSCKHRIGRHRDIARMYCLMLAFVKTNRDIEIKFQKSHTWTWIAFVSPFLFTRETYIF